MKQRYEAPDCLLCRLSAEDVLNGSSESATELSIIEQGFGEDWNW